MFGEGGREGGREGGKECYPAPGGPAESWEAGGGRGEINVQGR